MISITIALVLLWSVVIICALIITYCVTVSFAKMLESRAEKHYQIDTTIADLLHQAQGQRNQIYNSKKEIKELKKRLGILEKVYAAGNSEVGDGIKHPDRFENLEVD